MHIPAGYSQKTKTENQSIHNKQQSQNYNDDKAQNDLEDVNDFYNENYKIFKKEIIEIASMLMNH